MHGNKGVGIGEESSWKLNENILAMQRLLLKCYGDRQSQIMAEETTTNQFEMSSCIAYQSQVSVLVLVASNTHPQGSVWFGVAININSGNCSICKSSNRETGRQRCKIIMGCLLKRDGGERTKDPPFESLLSFMALQYMQRRPLGVGDRFLKQPQLLSFPFVFG